MFGFWGLRLKCVGLGNRYILEFISVTYVGCYIATTGKRCVRLGTWDVDEGTRASPTEDHVPM